MATLKHSWALVGRARLVLSFASVALLAACLAPADERTASSGAASTAFANDQPAYDYFAAKGLLNFQAAGIVGNLDQESGVDPTAVESGGPGRGIAQWSVGGRWDTDQGDNLLAYATQQGESSSSLTLQLDFIWYELQTFSDYGLANLKATTNVTDATVAFETDFEGCASCDEATRISYAKDVLQAYGNDPVVVDAGSPHDAAVAGDASARDALADTEAPSADAEPSGATGDGGSPGSSTGSTDDGGPARAADVSDPSSGCAVGATGTPRPAEGVWLLPLAFVLGRARRRRAAVSARALGASGRSSG